MIRNRKVPLHLMTELCEAAGLDPESVVGIRNSDDLKILIFEVAVLVDRD